MNKNNVSSIALAEMAKFMVVRADDTYTARFAAALAACGFSYVDDLATAQNFPESIFGEVGEGHILAQPPKTKKGYWTEQEIDSWLAKRAKEGYEAGTLADGLDFVAKNPQAHLDGHVVFWASVASGGGVSLLGGRDSWRDLFVGRRGEHRRHYCRFLLRKVPATRAGQAQS